jgi:hypothetical protein
METFHEPREFLRHDRYALDRGKALDQLDLASIDPPIADIVTGFGRLPQCFTLQCCWGHFVWQLGQDSHNLDVLPSSHVGPVRYRIAYVALCIENSHRGSLLRDSLAQLPERFPGHVQFGSPDWFWDQWVNSYALQVEPIAHQFEDEATLDVAEALETQRVRVRFFDTLKDLLRAELTL